MSIKYLDLFAGVGGWEAGLNDKDFIGIESDSSTCQTRIKAGLNTVYADIRELDPINFQNMEGLVGSPPCPSFSINNLVSGGTDIDLIIERAKNLNIEDSLHDQLIFVDPSEWNDIRSALTLLTLGWIMTIRPTWIALEQVPTVLPVWEEFAKVLESKCGYTTWTGNLRADQYGTPQSRNRAILMASYEEFKPPAPIYKRHGRKDQDNNLPEPITMKEAFDWRDGKHPEATGEGGEWYLRAGARTSSTIRSLDEPAFTLIGDNDISIKHGRAWVRATDKELSRVKPLESILCSTEEIGFLQGFPKNYPWQGNVVEKFQQIGNAIPVQLSKAILKELMRYNDFE